MKKAPVLKAMFPGAVLAIRFLLLAEPSLAANAECSSDSGIPSGVIAPIDVGHLRKSLADAGFTVGGFYLGETFANTGGIHHGATYDGVLWTYLIGDLHKAGLWKGLCFYTDAYQIHGRSITADDIGSLVTVSNYELCLQRASPSFGSSSTCSMTISPSALVSSRLIRNFSSVLAAGIF